MNESRVCVVGSGIIGLSTAVAIQQQNPNIKITIIAEKTTPDTTSDGAAGILEPSLAKHSSDWFKETRKYLASLIRSKESGEAGVGILSGYFLSNLQDKVDMSDRFYGCRKLEESELASLFPNYSNGWLVTTIQLESRVYLPWLIKKFTENGGKFIRRKVHSLSELGEEYNIIVNCTGLGARELVNDMLVYPIRGYTMRVKAPWVKHFIIDMDAQGDSYPHIIACRNNVHIGGTHQEHNWNVKPDLSTTKRTLKDCSKMLPSIVNAEVEYEWVGLRPGRPTVRLEKENMKIGNKPIQVVHNYGHGGRGISLHWGCALNAAKLVQDAINEDVKSAIQTKSKL